MLNLLTVSYHCSATRHTHASHDSVAFPTHPRTSTTYDPKMELVLARSAAMVQGLASGLQRAQLSDADFDTPEQSGARQGRQDSLACLVRLSQPGRPPRKALVRPPHVFVEPVEQLGRFTDHAAAGQRAAACERTLRDWQRRSPLARDVLVAFEASARSSASAAERAPGPFAWWAAPSKERSTGGGSHNSTEGQLRHYSATASAGQRILGAAVR